MMKSVPSSIPSVRACLAIASGKGGVGKSSISCHLAASFQALGYKTALLDADIYGSSIPAMMRITQKPEVTEDKKFKPVWAHGIQCFSMGLLVDQQTPIIWRGLILQTALKQLLFDVAWDNVDVLVIDLPPGTGDIQLTLCQKVILTGAVIVSTPQMIALDNARKGLLMFQKLGVPVLGIIENMSGFTCSHCGEETSVFDQGGGKKEAEKHNIPLLGNVPLDQKLRVASESGLPLIVSQPDHPISREFLKIAKRLSLTWK